MSRVPADVPVGELFTAYARHQQDQTFWLSRPMDIAPALGTTVSLADLAALVDHATDELRRVGVSAGDRVAVVKQPSPDVSVIQQAVIRLGAVAAMIWPDPDSATVSTLLGRLDRPWVVTDARTARDVLDTIPLRQLTRGVLGVRDGHWSFEGHDLSPSTLRLPPRTILITHSSGTTGTPKLMCFDESGISAHTLIQTRVAAALRLRGPGALCLSYVHNRMPSALATALRRRADLILLDDGNVDHARVLLSGIRPHVIETFPNVYLEWEALAEDEGRPLSRARVFINTFDALHPSSAMAMLRASERRFPIFLQAYGATETGPLTVRIHTRRSASRGDLRCVGYPLPGLTKNRVVSRPDTQDRRRRVGEIEVRAKGAALTYVGEPSLQAPGNRTTWWPTGDIGSRGRWGCLHLLDRIVDESPGGASNLALEDTLLAALPQLREVVIIADGNMRQSLPVVATRQDEPLDTIAWSEVTSRISHLAPPFQVRWADIPRSSTWKVRRPALRQALADGSITSVPSCDRSTS